MVPPLLDGEATGDPLQLDGVPQSYRRRQQREPAGAALLALLGAVPELPESVKRSVTGRGGTMRGGDNPTPNSPGRLILRGRSRPYAHGWRRSEGRGDSMLRNSRAETRGGPSEWSKDRGLGAFVRRHGLVSFYALAYFISWLFWMPYVLSQNGLGVLDVSFPKILGDTQLAGI